jgi:hypothetical protein
MKIGGVGLTWICSEEKRPGHIVNEPGQRCRNPNELLSPL